MGNVIEHEKQIESKEELADELFVNFYNKFRVVMQRYVEKQLNSEFDKEYNEQLFHWLCQISLRIK